jgi:hypothetical protein
MILNIKDKQNSRPSIPAISEIVKGSYLGTATKFPSVIS